MKTRVARVEDGFWRIRSRKREIGAEEQARLVEYFRKIRFPYKIIGGKLRVSESVRWENISERLQYFYDGEAEVYPF